MSEASPPNVPDIQELPQFVGTGTLARIFGVSVSYVSKMAERGIIPKAGHGKYPFVECMQAYISYLDRGETGEDEDKTNYQVEKTRLTAAQANKVEFELAILRHDYIAVEETKAAWCKILRELNAQLMNLPAKIGPLAVSVKKPQEGFDLTMKFVKQLLKELSETEVIVIPDGTASES